MKLRPISNRVNCRIEIPEGAGRMETAESDRGEWARVAAGRDSDRVEMLHKKLRLELRRAFALLRLRRFLIADAPIRNAIDGAEFRGVFGAGGAAVGFGL
jgi:hypothetical protein